MFHFISVALNSILLCNELTIYGCVVVVVDVQQGGATAAGAWSRATAISSSGSGGGEEITTGVRLDPRVETCVDAYATLNRLLTDYVDHVSMMMMMMMMMMKDELTLAWR